MISTHPADSPLHDLRAQLDGVVVAPGEEGWDEARQAWNLAADQRPALVALPRCVRDVQRLVRHAHAHGLRIAMQGTGHNAVAMGPLDGTILVRTSEMRGVTIDAERRVARVEAGVLWDEVTGPASELGLAPLAGSSPDVGVVGYCLGGGVSWLARRHGLASESVRAIELVTADGRSLRADAEDESELFWALRGGGGSFAAVIAIEIELLPLAEVYAGMLLWPASRAREVWHAWAVWTADAPDAATTAIRTLHLPPLPELPEFLRGRSVVVIDGAVLGSQADAEAVLAPLRALEPEVDTFAMVPPAALSRIHMDPEEPVPALSDHAILDTLSADAVDALVDAGTAPDSPLLMLELRHIGGALAEPGTGVLGRLPGRHLMFCLGVPTGPEAVAALEASFALVRAAVAPYGSGWEYLNMAERPVDPAAFYGDETLARLRAVKARVDPAGIFQGNHDIVA